MITWPGWVGAQKLPAADDGGTGGTGGNGGGTIIGGGGNGQDYSSILNDILNQLGDINNALNGNGEGSGTWSGDGGLSGLDGVEGMDKGEDDLKGVVDALIKSINDNETIKLIKGHRYIKTSSPVCTYSFTIWGHTQQISFCEYEDTLRTLGHVLLGLVTLMGFMHVVRTI